MDRLAQDIRLALRGFRRSPTFAVTAVLVLGLAIGMAVAMLSIVDAVLIRRLPVRDQDGLVVLWTYHDPALELSIDHGTIDRMRPEMRTMQNIAGVIHFGVSPLPWIDGDRTTVLNRTLVTANFFDVLGAHPALGRLLRPDDDRKGAEAVMVISFALWQSQFDGDSTIIGRHLVSALDRTSFRIVGVAPPGLDYPASVDCWLPVGEGTPAMLAVARIARGADIAAARTEFFSLAQRLNPGFPFVGAKAITFSQAVVGDVRPALVALTVAVVLLLVIACVNVGNLMLLRATARTHEFAVRRALGASSRSIMELVMVESVMLGTGGGLLGFVGAQAIVRVLLAFAPTRLPNADVLRLTGVPFPVVVGVTLFAVLAFGVVPALVASRSGIASPLRLSARSGAETKQRLRLRQLLVALQVALALIMLTGAGLVVRSLQQLERVNLGFSSEHLSDIYLSLPMGKYDWAGPKMLALGDELTSRWRALPGVEALTPIALPPFFGASVIQSMFIVQGRGQTARDAQWFPMEEGGPDYFRTLGIPLIRGRGFLDADRENAPLVAVISQAIAHRYWPGEDPIGKRIRFWSDSASWRTIVGVAGDVRWRSLRDATPTVYLPWRQGFWQGGFALRTTGTLTALLPTLRRTVREIDPQLDVYRARTLDAELAGPLAQPRLNAYLLSGFGLVALLLAAIGLYGVMASTVRERTRDIGIRMALGATAGRVRDDVLRQASRTFLIGALVGLVGAAALTRLLTRLLFEVSPVDPAAFLTAAGTLCVVALCAAYIPARRATRIDPAQALRVE